MPERQPARSSDDTPDGGTADGRSEGRRVTIADVAKAAGVSVATVSNVMNGHPHVRERTRAKVLAAVDELGYRASRAARSLPAGKAHMLAYCLGAGDAANWALDEFLHQTVATASDADLEVLLFRQRGTDPTEPYREVLRRGGADGFLLSGIVYDDPRIPFLKQQGVPFACFGRVPDPEVSWIDVDGAAGMAAAVDHLADVGCRHLAFLGWPEGSQAGDDRLDGFLRRSDELALDAAIVGRVENDFDQARKLVPDLLDQGPVDAIVCVSDVVALGCIAGLREAGLEPGGDVAVVGFDDTPSATLTHPGLTSLRQPMDRVGALLVEQLIARLTGNEVPPSRLVEPDLIIRQSTARTGATDGPGNQTKQEGET